MKAACDRLVQEWDQEVCPFLTYSSLLSQFYLQNLLHRFEVKGFKFTEAAGHPVKRSCHLTMFLLHVPLIFLGVRGSMGVNPGIKFLKSNGNLLTVTRQDFIPHCHLKIKSYSKNHDLNDSNNIGTVQKRLKPKYKSALALNSQLEENECKFVINWLKSQIIFSKKIFKN